MAKLSKKLGVTNQSKFCVSLMDRLHESTCLWADADCPDYVPYESGMKEEGATRTQIKQDIVRLRRELNKLSRLVG